MASRTASPSSRSTSSARSCGVNLSQRQLCFKILCEHEAGWHHATAAGAAAADVIAAPRGVDEAYVARFSPYLARITALLRNSQQLHLNCVSGDDGALFMEWLEEVSACAAAAVTSL